MGESVQDHATSRRHDAAGRRVRAECTVCGRDSSAGCDGRDARVSVLAQSFLLRSRARSSRRHRRHHPRLDAFPFCASTRRACCSTTSQLVAKGIFLEAELRALLSNWKYPARSVEQNLADLRAQVAACQKGAAELAAMVEHFGLQVVQAYMQHVQDNAEEAAA